MYILFKKKLIKIFMYPKTKSLFIQFLNSLDD